MVKKGIRGPQSETSDLQGSGSNGNLIPPPQLRPLQDLMAFHSPPVPASPGPGAMRFCLLLQTKVIQGTSFKRQDVGCELPDHGFKGNLL